jgi:uncharacterized membrane-anchored protein YjiN (DUF445 family)
MISEKHIERINKVIKDMVFDFNGEILTNGREANFKYQFEIIGQKKMISVGEYYDHLEVSVKIIDGDEMVSLIFAVFKSLGTNIVKDYKLRNQLDRHITNDLSYFFSGEGVRITISDIEFSEEYEEKINNIIKTELNGEKN